MAANLKIKNNFHNKNWGKQRKHNPKPNQKTTETHSLRIENFIKQENKNSGKSKSVK